MSTRCQLTPPSWVAYRSGPYAKPFLASAKRSCESPDVPPATGTQALVGPALGQLGQLRLDPIQIVVHADPVSLSCSRMRARPRLTRLRTTISEHFSWVAISR